MMNRGNGWEVNYEWRDEKKYEMLIQIEESFRVIVRAIDSLDNDLKLTEQWNVIKEEIKKIDSLYEKERTAHLGALKPDYQWENEAEDHGY